MSHLTRARSSPLKKGRFSSLPVGGLCATCPRRRQPSSPAPAVASVASVSALALVKRHESWASTRGSAGPGEPSSPVFLCVNPDTGECGTGPCASHRAHQSAKAQNEQSCFCLRDGCGSADELKRKRFILFPLLVTFPYISSRTYSVDKGRFSFLMCQVSA